MRKKIQKFLKFLILVFIINQIIILLNNNDIRRKSWKSISDSANNRLNNTDVLSLDSNLKYNLICYDSGEFGIIQLYTGQKIVVSNLTLTKWYYHKSI